jgi:hypothetical protein
VGVDDRDSMYDADELGRVLRELGALSVRHAKRRER